MSSSLVFPQGTAVVTVPAAGSLAVASFSTCTVQRVFGAVNQPTDISTIGTANDSTGIVTFGPFATGAVLIVRAGASFAFFEAGASPTVKDVFQAVPQPDPTAVNVTGAVSAAAIFSGIVTSTTAAAVTGTVPTGTVMDAAAQFSINDSFDWTVINTGAANAFTVGPAATHTILGNAVVALSSSGRFRTRKTAANTFVTYRIG
jgi:hypothetical protein